MAGVCFWGAAGGLLTVLFLGVFVYWTWWAYAAYGLASLLLLATLWRSQQLKRARQAEYRTARRSVAFGGKNAGRADVSSETASPAEHSLLRSFVDPASTFGRPTSAIP